MGGMMPTNFIQGMLSGLGHPIIGLDHFAFILLIGLLAVTLSGASRLLVPGSFIAATILGTGVHMMSMDLPIPEIIIAFSVLTAGILVLLRKSVPTFLLGIGVAGFGLFHGFAYGESVVGAEASPVVAYLIGLSLIQFAIVTSVVFGMTKLANRSEHFQNLVSKGTATAGTIIGALFLAMNFA
jgi:urease accessory protein